MATRHYLKELVSKKLYLPSGASVPFEDIGGGYGVLKTGDPYLIAELDKSVKAHVGGVVPLTEAEFGEWEKKKLSSQYSLESQPARDREALGPMSFQQLQQVRAAGAAAVVGPSLVGSPNQAAQQASQQKVEPLTIPETFTKPKAARVPRAGAPLPPAPAP